MIYLKFYSNLPRANEPARFREIPGCHFEWRHLTNIICSGIIGETTNVEKRYYIIVSTLPADGLASVGARTSADMVMSKFRFLYK